MSKQLIVDNFINPNKKPKPQPFNRMQKTCPKCHGSGTNTPMMMVDIPGLTPPRRPHKNSSSRFTCERCGGSGYVPMFDPIIM